MYFSEVNKFDITRAYVSRPKKQLARDSHINILLAYVLW